MASEESRIDRGSIGSSMPYDPYQRVHASRLFRMYCIWWRQMGEELFCPPGGRELEFSWNP